MAQSNYTFRELCELIHVDPKTVRKWIAQAIPPISPEIDKRDGRILRFTQKDVQRLIKEHGISLDNPRSKVALDIVTSDILTELQDRIERLEHMVQGLQGQLAATPASAGHRRAAGTPASRRASTATNVSPAPDGLLPVSEYAANHGVSYYTIRSAIRDGRLAVIHQEHIYHGHVQNTWLDADGHANASSIWRQHPQFHPCAECME